MKSFVFFFPFNLSIELIKDDIICSLTSFFITLIYFNFMVLFKLQPGYERLCCLRCIQPRDHNFATTCVCRVPKHLREEKVIECVHCGCGGCASGD
jgi:hypothetical protein